MKLVRFTPTFPSLFDEFFKTNFDDWFTQKTFGSDTRIAPVNISESDDKYTLELAAPGMKKDDFTVEVHGNVLTIKGSVKNEEKKEEKNYKYQEFYHSEFTRTFELPKGVDTQKIHAQYTDGILHVDLAKTEEAKEKQPKLIEVK